MIEWKPEALTAALSAKTDECPEGLQYVIIRGLSAMKFNHPSIESVDLMLTALDAAVKAQGIKQQADSSSYFECGVTHGRAEAFEEAAKIADEHKEEALSDPVLREDRFYARACSHIATELRNLAKGETK